LSLRMNDNTAMVFANPHRAFVKLNDVRELQGSRFPFRASRSTNTPTSS
jgi:hypothetical protein